MAERLKRSTKEKILAGVCGGFAEHFGWDPTLVRILFLILIFSSAGTMILVYLILILVIPRDDRIT